MVPAGIDNGQSIRIRGKGEPGINGGERGDLLVSVLVDKHPKFQRQEYDLYSSEPITFTQAALGGTIQINTIDVRWIIISVREPRQIRGLL